MSPHARTRKPNSLSVVEVVKQRIKFSDTFSHVDAVRLVAGYRAFTWNTRVNQHRYDSVIVRTPSERKQNDYNTYFPSTSCIGTMTQFHILHFFHRLSAAEMLIR